MFLSKNSIFPNYPKIDDLNSQKMVYPPNIGQTRISLLGEWPEFVGFWVFFAICIEEYYSRSGPKFGMWNGWKPPSPALVACSWNLCHVYFACNIGYYLLTNWNIQVYTVVGDLALACQSEIFTAFKCELHGNKTPLWGSNSQITIDLVTCIWMFNQQKHVLD